MTSAQDTQPETLLVRVGPLKAVLLIFVLVFSALVFLFMSAVAVAIDVHNLFGRAALLLVGLALLALAIYFLLLTVTARNRVEVLPDRVRLRIADNRGPLSLPWMIRDEIPYGAVQSIETREEVYSTFGLVTILRVFNLVKRDGARLPLGAMAENWGPQMPFDKAAALIAQRAGSAVVDKGTVRVGGVLQAMVKGAPPWTAQSLEPTEIAAVRSGAMRTMQVIGLLLAVVAIARACSPH